MDLERFQQFMLDSAARHEAEIGTLRESIREMNASMRESTARHEAKFAVIDETLDRVANTLEVLVNNQVHLQEHVDEHRRDMDEFRRVFVHHATDPNAHRL